MALVDAVARIQQELRAEFQWSAGDHPSWRSLDRGLLRGRIEAVVADLESRGGNRNGAVAEEIVEVLRTHPGDRLALAVFDGSPWHAMIGPAIAPLLANAFHAEDAVQSRSQI